MKVLLLSYAYITYASKCKIVPILYPIHAHEHAARLACPFGHQTTAQGGCLVCKNTECKCVCIVDNREGKQVQRLSYMSVGIEGEKEPRGQRRAESPRSCHRPVNVTMRCSLRGEGGAYSSSTWVTRECWQAICLRWTRF